jgi:hypothetical protein
MRGEREGRYGGFFTAQVKGWAREEMKHENMKT